MADLLESAAAAFAVVRLIQLRLASRFPALLRWLAVVGLCDLVLGLQPQTSHGYFWTWLVVTPLQSLFAVLAVSELFTLVFRDYPGIRTLGRAGMYTGLGGAAAGSLALAVWFHRLSSQSSSQLFLAEVLQRSVVFSLAVVIITILFFLSRYPLSLTRNTYVCSSFFSAIFISEALRLLLDSLELRLNNPAIDLAEALFISVCMILWAVLLQHADVPAPQQISFSTIHEEHLLGQLASLNQILSRAGRQ